MSDASGRSLPRRQVLRITATVGASAILGGGLLRAALERAGLHRVRQTRTQMGTLVTITAVHPDAEAARMMVADTFDEIERLESLLSRHRVGTPVWSLNETGVVRAPPPEVLEVVQKGLDYSALTAGAFDITIAPLLNLYYSNFSETGVAPDRENVGRGPGARRIPACPGERPRDRFREGRDGGDTRRDRQGIHRGPGPSRFSGSAAPRGCWSTPVATWRRPGRPSGGTPGRLAFRTPAFRMEALVSSSCEANLSPPPVTICSTSRLT